MEQIKQKNIATLLVILKDSYQKDLELLSINKFNSKDDEEQITIKDLQKMFLNTKGTKTWSLIVAQEFRR